MYVCGTMCSTMAYVLSMIGDSKLRSVKKEGFFIGAW